MKRIYLLIPIALSFFLFTNELSAQRNLQNAYLMSIDFEYSTPTSAYGTGLTFNFDVGLSRFYMGLGVFAGFEDGLYEDGLYSGPSNSDLLNGARGNTITDSYFNSLKSDFYYGGKLTGNLLLILDSSIEYRGNTRTRLIEDFVVLSVGIRYGIHPATVGEYTVSSEDASYIYRDTVEYEFLEGYSNFSPEISINYGMYGISYAYYKHPKGIEVHTIGLKINAFNF